MIGDISRQSFKLHAELANKLDGHMKYGYRSVDTYSVLFKTGESQKSSSNAVSWIDPAGVCRVEKIGSTKDTAQVHPRLFTETVLEAAKATGVVTLQSGVGVSHLIIKDKTAVGVQLDNNQVVDADGVIVSMGPWSGQLPILDLPIEGRRAHSIVFRPSQSVPAQALFTAILDGTRSHEPEVYPRPDGTVYMCGATDNEPLPASGGDVQVSSKAIEQLEQLRDMLAPELYGGETIAQQACYLPISRDGSPLVGHHPTYKHLYIATGHSCWGILQAPSTGKMIAELVANGRISCVDKEAVEAVDPKNRC
ncbi:FAD dependent oxidoreductase [Fennellomyces sp. T-0311]|nr:FAD dependent oxidoreductase [Fennellomyces sp. T-0311]